MGLKEDVLALAEELDGVSVKENCEACLASGTELCRGDLECAESAHKACAKRLRAIAEHDADDVTTVSAYDLLPDEDRKAIAWVSKHGGLDEVEKRLMPEGMEWPKVDGEPVDFKTFYGPSLGVLEAVSIYNNGACEVMSHDGIVKNATEIHVFKPKVLDADGEEIREGDVLYSIETGDSVTVDSIEPGNPWVVTTGGALQHCAKFTHRAPVIASDGEPLEVGKTVWFIDSPHEATVEKIVRLVDGFSVYLKDDIDEYVGVSPSRLTHHRPVLDADGVPIKVGDTVWDTETGCGRTVRAVNDNETVEFDGYENRGWFGRFLTHRAPVLAADGKPLEVGQTVWHVGNGVEFTVIGLPNPGEYQAVKLRLDDGAFTGLDPDQLTHQRPVLDEDGVPIKVGDTVWDIETGIEFEVTGIASAFEIRVKDESMKIGVWTTPCGFTHAKPEPPDTWERVEEDALLPAGDYRERHGMEKRDGMTWPQQIREDLVRRCRALAERGA